jgi:hypothetical protein
VSVQADAEAKAKAAAAAAAAAASAPSTDAAEAPVESLTTVEAVQVAMDAPGVSKTRMQKLKQRRKQLQVHGGHLAEAHAARAGIPAHLVRSCIDDVSAWESPCCTALLRGEQAGPAVRLPQAQQVSTAGVHSRCLLVQDAAAADAEGGADEGEAQDTVESVQKALEQGGLNANQKKKLKAKLKKLQVRACCATCASAEKEAVNAACTSKGKQVCLFLGKVSFVKVRVASLAHDFPQDKEKESQQRESQAASAAEGKAGGKGKGKKPSAAVLAIQKELQERKAREEAAARVEEEKRRAEEAAARAEAEEEARLEAEKAARAEARRLKKEQQRKEGKPLTAKQKAEAAKLAAMREVLGGAEPVCITPCRCVMMI